MKTIRVTIDGELLLMRQCDDSVTVGDTICDPFVGSASSLVVFEELGFDYVAFEKDKDYYADSTARLEKFRKQGSLFTGREIFEASKQVSNFDNP